MKKGWIVILWMLLCTAATAQQTVVVVPQSAPALDHSFLFADSNSGTLLLFYEKRLSPPGSLVLEVRRQDSLNLVKRLSTPLRPKEFLQLAAYQPPFGILAIVAQRPVFWILKMDPSTGKAQRSRLYSLEEAQKLDRSVQQIDVAGLTWNDRLQRAYLLLNLRSPSGVKTLLASFDSSGVRTGEPVRIDAGKGEHLDLALNSCRGDFAAVTAKVVRLLKAPKVLPLEQPEEIAFDPVLCRYGVVRRPFSQIPQFYYLDASLHVQSSIQLPGEAAPQLIQIARNQVVYNRERHSFIYPTWAKHQRLYINEITPSGIHTSLLVTPIDSSSMSVAVLGNRVYLLLSGLQFGLFERLHRLLLMSTPVP